MKFLFDKIFALLGLSVLFIPFVTIAILIKINMPGPVFFIQKRVGQFGKEFKLFKFRTMKVESSANDGSFDVGDSSRVTPLGSILRKYKLDELPQLINVLLGDMSFVGPRPEVRQWTEIYTKEWEIVHLVKPGITDNASIEFRFEELILAQSTNPVNTYHNEILPRKLSLYIEYVNNRSFWGDLTIIIKTLKSL